MTLGEFSNQFDVLVSSYRRFKDFDNREFLDSIEFDEYEKSLFLTKAQEELVNSLYSGKNAYEDSFERTEELRRLLSNLVVEENLSPISSLSSTPLGMNSSSKFFTLPDDLWYITYEAVRVDREDGCEDTQILDVVPITQDKYHRVKRNPFRGANTKRALRLDLADGVVEIVSNYNVTSYYVRYVKRPEPIILTTLPDDLSIGNMVNANPCKLHSALHQRILEDAVRMALQSKGIAVKEEQRNNNNQ
jgi:hypothetical protein